MFWNLLQGNGTEIGVLIVLAGAVIEAMRRFHNAQKTANERLKEDLTKVVNAASERLGRVEEQQREDSERLRRVEEQQKADAEQLKRVEERQIGGEEHMKVYLRIARRYPCDMATCCGLSLWQETRSGERKSPERFIASLDLLGFPPKLHARHASGRRCEAMRLGTAETSEAAAFFSGACGKLISLEK